MGKDRVRVRVGAVTEILGCLHFMSIYFISYLSHGTHIENFHLLQRVEGKG